MSLQQELEEMIQLKEWRIEELEKENAELKAKLDEAVDLLRNKDRWSHCDRIENFIKKYKVKNENK